MVLDTLTNDVLLDLSGSLASIVHPMVMATTTSTSSDNKLEFLSGLQTMFCDNQTFASYCTITRNADGTVSKTISSEKWTELAGIAAVVGLAILAYLIVALVGMAAFPPIVICLAMESGDLNKCSGGLFK